MCSSSSSSRTALSYSRAAAFTAVCTHALTCFRDMEHGICRRGPWGGPGGPPPYAGTGASPRGSSSRCRTQGLTSSSRRSSSRCRGLWGRRRQQRGIDAPRNGHRDRDQGRREIHRARCDAVINKDPFVFIVSSRPHTPASKEYKHLYISAAYVSTYIYIIYILYVYMCAGGPLCWLMPSFCCSTAKSRGP